MNFIYLQNNIKELKKDIILTLFPQHYYVNIKPMSRFIAGSPTGALCRRIVWYPINHGREQLFGSLASINIPILKKPFTKNRFVHQTYLIEVCFGSILFNMKSLLFIGYQFSCFCGYTDPRNLRIPSNNETWKAVWLDMQKKYRYILCSSDLDSLNQLHDNFNDEINTNIPFS